MFQNKGLRSTLDDSSMPQPHQSTKESRVGKLEEDFWREEDLFEEAFALSHNHPISGPGEQKIALTSNLVRELKEEYSGESSSRRWPLNSH